MDKREERNTKARRKRKERVRWLRKEEERNNATIVGIQMRRERI